MRGWLGLPRAWTEWLSGPQAEFRDARERHMAWVGGERSPLAARGPFDPADAPQSEAVQIGVRDGLIAWTDAARNMHAICRQRGFDGFPLVVVDAPLCRPELLCEIEAEAVLPLAGTGA